MTGSPTIPIPSTSEFDGNGDVVRSFSAGGWLIMGFDAVRDAMRDTRFGVDPRKSPFVEMMVRQISRGEDIRFFQEPTMLNLDPPDHTRLRRLARRGFLHRYIQSLESTVRALADECLAPVQGQATFDLMETLAGPLPAFLIADILGVPREGRRRFQEWSDYLARHARTFEYEAIKKTDKAYNELMDYLAGMVEEKRANPGDDLISQLITADGSGSLSSPS